MDKQFNVDDDSSDEDLIWIMYKLINKNNINKVYMNSIEKENHFRA